MKSTIIWTGGGKREVKTKKRGEEVMKVWRKWYERHGWTVHKSGNGFIGKPPGWAKNPTPWSRHAITFWYD